eukprot:3204238-Amphidinium_carterae.1
MAPCVLIVVWAVWEGILPRPSHRCVCLVCSLRPKNVRKCFESKLQHVPSIEDCQIGQNYSRKSSGNKCDITLQHKLQQGVPWELIR